MKSLMLFWRIVLEDLSTLCHVSAALDWKYVQRRFEQEGDEFLTLTLPTFAKDFERSLELGKVNDTAFLGFKKRGKLPLFLGGFLDLLFDRATGQLLDATQEELPSRADAVFAVRQLTLMFGKIEKPCTPERERAAFAQYIQCEQELAAWENEVSPYSIQEFRMVFRKLFGRDVLSPLDEDVFNHNLVPKHGPGATADRLVGNGKWDLRTWTDRLEREFPFGEYALPNWHYAYVLDDVQFLEPGQELPVRVISVPKTQKTPRIIAVEPTCMMFVQQAMSQRLVEYISRDPILGCMIGFRDQLPNQELARQGSLDGSLATLDLSEASDRVSNLLVQEAVGSFSNLARGLDACRSRTADVQGEVVHLSKYASMGSALTFPIEAMVFLTCVFHGISKQLNRPADRKLFAEFAESVRVYGDDIVVPVGYVASVVQSLETFGFKVNAHKSFWTGMFRESCGGDYYAGVDVSVTRVRREFPSQRTDVQETVSLVSLRNQMYFAGLWKAVEHLDDLIAVVLPHYPVVNPESPVVGRHSYLEPRGERWSDTLHAPLVRGYVVKSLAPKSPISGEGALLKCLTKEGLQPFEDVRHLERQGRPDAVTLKLRWASPH